MSMLDSCSLMYETLTFSIGMAKIFSNPCKILVIVMSWYENWWSSDHKSCQFFIHSSPYDNFGNLDRFNFSPLIMELHMYATSSCEPMFVFLDRYNIFTFAPFILLHPLKVSIGIDCNFPHLVHVLLTPSIQSSFLIVLMILHILALQVLRIDPFDVILLVWSWDHSFDEIYLMSKTRSITSSEWWMWFFLSHKLLVLEKIHRVGGLRNFQWIHEFHNWMMRLGNQDSSSTAHLDSLEKIVPCDNIILDRNWSRLDFIL